MFVSRQLAKFASAVALCAFSVASLVVHGQSQQPENPSFETPTYASAGRNAAPAGAIWAFTGTAGIERFQTPGAVASTGGFNGMQAAYLSSTGTAGSLGAVAQMVNFPLAGQYTVRFMAGRLGATNSLAITVGGVPVDSAITPRAIGSPGYPQLESWWTLPFSISAPGNYEVKLAATQASATLAGGNVLLVDQVTVAGVPFALPNSSFETTTGTSPVVATGWTLTDSNIDTVTRSGMAGNNALSVGTGSLSGSATTTTAITVAAGRYSLSARLASSGGGTACPATFYRRTGGNGVALASLPAVTGTDPMPYTSASFDLPDGTFTFAFTQLCGAASGAILIDAVVLNRAGPNFANVSFETPNLGAPANAYAIPRQYNPTGSSWTFTGTAAGIQGNPGTSATAPVTDVGKQYAVTHSSNGTFTQALTVEQGTYAIVARASTGAFRVTINGTPLTGVLRGSTVPNGTGNGNIFSEVMSEPFTVLNTTTVTLGFTSASASGFSLDNPRIVAVNGDLPPTVTITSPTLASGKSYALAQGPNASGLSVTAAAVDAEGLQVNSLKVFNNGVQVGATSSTSPFTVSLPTLAIGTYTLSAAATDVIGMTGTTTRPLKINNLPQGGYTVQNGGPHQLDPGATASITVSAAPSDTDGTIAMVEHLLDGTPVVGCTRTSTPWSPCAISLSPQAANYSVTARATDDDGGVTTYSPTAITVNAKPVVTAVSLWLGATQLAPSQSGPNNYVRNGSQPANTLWLKVVANDTADGGTVTSYTFQKSGVDIPGCVVITVPQCSLPALAVSVTAHSFTVNAIDNRGGIRTSVPLSINVNSSGGPLSVMNLTIASASLVAATPAPTRALSISLSRSETCSAETLRVLINGIVRYNGPWADQSGNAYNTTRQFDISAPGTYAVDAMVICTSPTADTAVATTVLVNPAVPANAFTETFPDVENPSAPTATGVTVGSLPGSATVDPSGAVTYSIPMPVSPGTAGMQPSLALSYSSQAGRGIVGTGWSLSGFSTIHRCPASVILDGFKGTVTFNPPDDRFCLDGMRLIALTTGADGLEDTEYRTERDSHSRIFSRRDAARNRLYWTVETKSGQTLVFNEPLHKANIDGSGWNTQLIKAWGISRVQDTVGNYMSFSYTVDHSRGWLLPLAIDYTGNATFGPDLSVDPTPTPTRAPYARVEIGYDMANRADTSVLYDGTGSYGVVPPIVTRITSTVDGGNVAHRLNLSYESSATTGRTRLVSVQGCGGGTNSTTGLCLPATVFAYNNAAVSATQPWLEIGDIGFNVDLANGRGILPLDLNGDGKTELLLSNTFSGILSSIGNLNVLLTNAADAAGQNIYSVMCGGNVNVAPCAADANSAPVLGDFNGDGFTDFVFTVQVIASGVYQSRFVVCLAVPPNPTQMQCEIKLGWGAHNEFDDLFSPYGDGLTHPAVPTLLVGDFDGDGKSDVLVLGPSGSLYFDYATGDGKRRNISLPIYDVEKVSVGDFDGDGRLDIAQQLTSPSTGFSTWMTWLSRSRPTDTAAGSTPGSAFAASTNTAGPRKRSYQPHIADTNGDGLADLLAFDGNPEMWTSNGVPPEYGITPYLGQFRWHGCLSRGNGTFDCSIWRGPPSGEFDFAGKKFPLEVLGDFNGDGRTDLAIYDSDYSADNPGSAGRWWICVARSVVPLSAGRGAFDCGPTITGSTLQGGGVWSNGLVRKGRTQTNPNKYGYDVAVSGDFVGNGRSGLAGGSPCAYFPGNPICTFYPRITRLNVVDTTANIPDMLASVTNGLGITSNFTYKPITDNSIYTKGSGATYPELNIQTAMYVATEVKHDDGLNQGGKVRYTYKYEGLKGHTTGGGTLGFSRVTVKDEQSGITTETDYNNTYPARGLVTATRKKQSSGVLLNESTTTYLTIRPYANLRIHSFLPVTATEESWDLNGAVLPKTVTTTAYGLHPTELNNPEFGTYRVGDENTKFGCATNVEANTYAPNAAVGASPQFTKVVDNTYENGVGGWRWCRLQTATVKSTQAVYGSEASTEIRSSSFAYDGTTGLLNKEVVLPGFAEELTLTTNYSHDSFGNRIQADVVGSNGVSVETRTSKTTYDTRGRFPRYSENAMGPPQTEEYTFDSLLGVRTIHIDINGLTTTTKYDRLGRKVVEIRPDGTKTALTYNNTANAFGGITLTSLATGGGQSTVDSDRMGREVRKSVNISDAGSVRTSYVSTVYDFRGRVEKVSRPYFAGDTPNYPVARVYDNIDRVISETLSNDDASSTVTATDFAYGGNSLKTRVTVIAQDTQGTTVTRTSTSEIDERGKTRKITNTQGNTVEHAYDGAGNLTRTTRTVGTDKMVTVITYDLRGRKKTLADPDTGTYQYVYNAFGELLTQTDANGWAISSLYDKLGRVTQRSSFDLTSDYTYDSCAVGKGKLCTVTASGSASPSGTSGVPGHQRVLTYDTVGRLQTEVTRIASNGTGILGTGARTFTASTRFDAAGRVRDISYPNGQFVTRVYDNAGGWSKLLASNGMVLWQGVSADAEARWRSWTVGNSTGQLTTSTSFGANTGRLSSLTTTGAVQNLTLTYDGFGNIKTRKDDLNGYHRFGGAPEAYIYDDLNQLTRADIYEGTQTLTYDGFGRILTKTGVNAVSGAYTYKTSTLNGSTTTNQVNFANGRSYGYDNNGNVNSIANSITLSWTSFNQAMSLPVASAQGGGINTGNANAVITLKYGADNQRVLELLPVDVSVVGANQTASRYHLHSGASLFYEEDVRADNSVEQRAYFTGPLGVVAVHTTNLDSGGSPVTPSGPQVNAQNNTGTPYTLTYWHRDHLGSLTVTTDEYGAVRERMRFDPWGKPQTPLGSKTRTGDRGFTGHEHLAGGLIHMNGRIYDPVLGRFLSADIVVQFPSAITSYNRYAYVMNNPLAYTDPSGYFIAEIIAIVSAISSAVVAAAPYIAATAAVSGAIAMATGHSTAARRFFGVALVFGGMWMATGATVAQAAWWTVGSAFAAGGVQSGSLEGAIVAALSAGVGMGIGEIIGLANAGAFANQANSAVTSQAFGQMMNGSPTGCLACGVQVVDKVVISPPQMLDDGNLYRVAAGSFGAAAVLASGTVRTEGVSVSARKWSPATAFMLDWLSVTAPFGGLLECASGYEECSRFGWGVAALGVIPGGGAGRALPVVNKAVNSNLSHAAERAVERGVFTSNRVAADALRDLSASISKSGFPSNSVWDTARMDRVLVPIGDGGMAVYQVAKNGTAILKSVLNAK